MKHKRIALTGFKTFFALLALSSILLEIVTLIGRSAFDAGNFFSFFTVLSNLFAVVVLLCSAICTYRNRSSVALDVLRGGSTLFMVLTGVVFAILLSDLDPALLTAVPWDNTVLHYIMPIVLFVDWLIDPPKSRLRYRHAVMWLLFPLAYVVYTLIRGPIVDWYPYPFLNPANGGYMQVFVICIGISVFTFLAALLIRGMSLRLVRTK